MRADHLFDRLQCWLRIQLVKRFFGRNLKRIRRDAKTRKIKVVFLVSEIAKWKGQSVYDKLAQSNWCEPQIAVMELTRFAHLPVAELKERAEEKLAYFRSRGMSVVDIWKYGTKNCLDVKSIGADIVFYQQPWDLPRQMRPWVVARHALTFYFPYYTPNLVFKSLEVGHKLHRFLFGYIVYNAELAQFYERLMKTEIGGHVTRFLPLGHPAMDELNVGDVSDSGDYVIYAPHWSIQAGAVNPPMPISTFLTTGKEILEYAKRHSQVRWVFKPHPELRDALVRSGQYSQEEVDAYYDEWDSIGQVCLGGPLEYLPLFRESRAMITDCGSFLTEYGCTGRPIIWLVSSESRIDVNPIVRRLYSTFYEASDIRRLFELLDDVVLRSADPQKYARLLALKAMRDYNANASPRIVAYLQELLERKWT